MKCVIWNDLDTATQTQLLKRPVSCVAETLQQQCTTIINEVKNNGDAALREYTSQFDGVDLESFMIEVEILSIPKKHQQALQFAYEQLQRFHQQQLPLTQPIITTPGVICQRQAKAIQRVGLYVPGGSAPLVSTVLMLGVPAQIAGCPLRILATPPNKHGKVDPHILYAANLCGIKYIATIGGAQAIAALAYGTESIPKVDKIFGPGNAWVTQAKTLVAQDAAGASCDMPAGPSEVLIIADHNANPQFIAADLLAQAEHGVDSQVILITTSPQLAEQVIVAVLNQIKTLPRRNIIEKALAHSLIIIVSEVTQAIAISNEYAPEHLILNMTNAEKWSTHIECAGAVFIGQWTAETLGDYITGANHVLPTYGYARNTSGLGVTDFMTFINLQTVTASGIQAIGAAAEILAEIEGLHAHQRAVSLRLAAQNTKDKMIGEHIHD